MSRYWSSLVVRYNVPYFNWHALTPDNQVKTGYEFCRSAELLSVQLGQRGLIKVLAIEERPLSVFSVISDEERALFFRQMGSLLGAGITVIDALSVCKKTIRTARFQEVIADCQVAVSEGISFSAACAFHYDFFPPFACRLLEAGEELGSLAKICADLADHYEVLSLFSKKVRSALIVPLLTVICFLGVFGLIFGFVIPRFAILLRSMRVPISGTTELLFSCAEWLQAGGWFIVGGGLVLAVVVVRWLLLSRRRTHQWGHLILHIPFFGAWIQEVNAYAFFRTLGALLDGGVDISQALSMACLGISCEPLRVQYDAVAHAVTSGRALSQSFTEAGIRQTPLCQALVEVGESTGKLGPLLLQCAKDYDQRLTARLHMFGTVIQPIILLFLGLGIALLMFALYEPLFTMGSMVGQ